MQEKDQKRLNDIARQVMGVLIAREIRDYKDEIKGYKTGNWPEGNDDTAPQDRPSIAKRMIDHLESRAKHLKTAQRLRSIDGHTRHINIIYAELAEFEARTAIEKEKNRDMSSTFMQVVLTGFNNKEGVFSPQYRETLAELYVIAPLATCYGILLGEDERSELYMRGERFKKPASEYVEHYRQKATKILDTLGLSEKWQTLYRERRVEVGQAREKHTQIWNALLNHIEREHGIAVPENE